jgi:pyruvate dehydrogenase E2 component (dihydrolipoamide acetyltransferase)/2-oxoglutarate dehydrogenase E2 component (dihydrolipoamide succinyltransferase)
VAANITIPKLGMTMKEANLVEWKFNEGDWVEKEAVVLEIETEKTTWEVEAADSGFLHILFAANPDSPHPVGGVVGLLAETEEELAALQKESPAPVAVAEAEAAPTPAATVEKVVKAGRGGRVKASPVARKMAEEKGYDLATITGTGPGGRITKQDVEKAIEAGPPVAAPEPSEMEERDGRKIKEIIPLKGMRRAISKHMQQSLAISAQLTSMGEVEATNLKKFRANLVSQEETIGTRITYNDIYVLALAKTLKDIPMVNSSLVDDEIIVWEDINIGVAVALAGADVMGGGLIVPVVRKADKKSLTEISKELKNTIQKAREGKLLPDDVTGSTFTLTNMGGLGSGWGYGTPIINQPESAILGTGAIVDRPVVRDGEIVIRAMMPVSFTFDHRVLDGVPAGMFMGRLRQFIEDPLLLLV